MGRRQSSSCAHADGALIHRLVVLVTQIDMLIDMVTLANLDCDKLEDELEAVTGAEAATGDGAP